MTFYHASDKRFTPGDLIEPGHPANFSDEPSGYVFFTDNLEAAEFWEEFLGGQSRAEKIGYWPTIYRYEIEPPQSFIRDDHYVNDELSGVWMSERPLRIIGLLETFPGLWAGENNGSGYTPLSARACARFTAPS